MNSISIIYAYRDREVERIDFSLQSIAIQINEAVEVVFIDYGSNNEFSEKVRKVLDKYDFIKYYYLEAQDQLWNKSRALNFGIQQSNNENIFIADVDLLFSNGAIDTLQSLELKKNNFYLFHLGYLSKNKSRNLKDEIKNEKIAYFKKGDINGMLLVKKDALIQLRGYDEFYHFYGSEDVDLYARLENIGYDKRLVGNLLFYHIWHKGYQIADTNNLSIVPRLTNALRINQQHYFFTKNQKIKVPKGQVKWGQVAIREKKSSNREIQYSLKNNASEIEYYFNEVLTTISETFVTIKIKEDPVCRTLKHLLKNLSGKQSQKYITMKEVNDFILKKIIFDFRYHYYSYNISSDLKMITFKIQL